MPLKILLVPFGSEGDVNPLLWLGHGLAARGHDVLFLLSPHYGRLADRLGLAWQPVGAEADFLAAARDPRMFHPFKGAPLVIKVMVESIPHFEEAYRRTGGQFDLIVTSSFALAISTLAEAEKIPHLTLHYQPICLRSEFDTPLFHPQLAWLTHSPRWMKRLFFRFTDVTLWSLVHKPLNAFRRKLGLPALTHFYEDAVNGADGIAALFPDWFAPPQTDWPKNLRQFGFPLTHHSPQPLPESLLAFLSSGPPPVVWTHGSANFDIKHFQRRALAVSRALNLRCLLVSLDPPTEPLPTDALHISHIRFEDLFAHCAAAVHHGGIGTTAKCIAAGVPQLIVPRAHDQPDNAARIVRLGLGATLSYTRLDTPDLDRSLQSLLQSPDIKTRCQEYREILLRTDPLPALCDWAQSLATTTLRHTR